VVDLGAAPGEWSQVAAGFMGREGETWAQARAKRRSDQGDGRWGLSLDTPSGCWSEGAENSSVDAEERGVVIAVDRLRIAPIAVNATGNRKLHTTRKSRSVSVTSYGTLRGST